MDGEGWCGFDSEGTVSVETESKGLTLTTRRNNGIPMMINTIDNNSKSDKATAAQEGHHGSIRPRQQEEGKGRSSRSIGGYLQSFDFFGVTPTYQLPAFTSWIGFIASVFVSILFLWYVVLTLREYVKRPPELVLQGGTNTDGVAFPAPSFLAISLEYTDILTGQKKHLTSTNLDRYFRIISNHVTIQDQDTKPRIVQPLPLKDCRYGNIDNLVCIDHDNVNGEPLELEGDYIYPVYKYVEFRIESCVDVVMNDPTIEFPISASKECASKETVAQVIENQVKVRIHMELQDFDADKYHTEGKDNAVFTKEIQERWYLQPGSELLNEVYLQGREIQHERFYLGSPPLPETTTMLLDFGRIDSTYRPNAAQAGHFTFFIRLAEALQMEETTYWMPSILDLVGAWGAIFSFLTTLSFGLVATAYNQYRSNQEQKSKTQQLTTELLPPKLLKHEKYPKDLLLDARLYDKEHFNTGGQMKVTAEEFKIPTTVYGELRAFALEKHTEKLRAVELIQRKYSRFRFSSLQDGIMKTKRAAVRKEEAAPSTHTI